MQDSYNKSGVEQCALANFLDDYCIGSKNRSLSRGYLDDLGLMVSCAESSSDLLKAAKITSFVSFGNKTGDSYLIYQASIMYAELLYSFQSTMSKGATSNTIEALTTAVLLGLYEVCS